MNSENRGFLRFSSWAGIALPPVFSVMVAVESLLRPGYSQIAKEVSDLGVGPYSGIMNTNFIVSGTLALVFGLGLGGALSAENRRAGRRVLIALEIFGAGVVLAGVSLVLAGVAVGGLEIPEIPAYYFHTSASLVAFLAIIVAQFYTWRTVERGNRGNWNGYGHYSMLSGIASIVLLIVFLPTSFGPYQGLTERMFIAVQLIWIEVMALKLHRLPAQAAL